VWWTFPLAALIVIAVEGIIAMAVGPKDGDFLWGFGVGAAAALVMVVFDSPPWHIERWRVGANGELATARALRPLVAGGWTLINDIETGHGNIDHVLVGPPGVFLLETKNLSGIASVARGVLSVKWHEDPDDGYDNTELARHVRGAAAELHAALSKHGSDAWVQPVVVLWAIFEQRSVLSGRVAWIRGREVANVLTQRPVELSAQEIDRLTQALHAYSTASGRASS
jgi:hypothetical protein